MEEPVRTATYLEWIDFIFDHQKNPEWYKFHDTDRWDGSEKKIIASLTRLFLGSAKIIAPFNDAQISNGLKYITGRDSEYIFAVYDDSITLDKRIKLVQSFYILFKDIFTVRCSSKLSHLNEAKENPINSICYMWWDIFPFQNKSQGFAIDELNIMLMTIMEKSLYLKNLACQESALHGLGHIQYMYPEAVESIIEKYLIKSPTLDNNIVIYASLARKGQMI